jgi:hypothetical protein
MLSPMWLALLTGCGLDWNSLLPPLTLEGMVVRDLTYDHLDADLEFLVDDESDPEDVSAMDYAVEVEGDPVAQGDTSDTEVDGNVILAPVAVEIGDLPGWAELVGRDNAVPFEVTGTYAYHSGGVSLDFVLVGSGELPAPRAPELDAAALSPDDTTLRLGVHNRDETPITFRIGQVSVRIGGEEVAAGAPPPLSVLPDGVGEVRIPLTRVDEGWGEAIDVELELEAEVDTIFGPIPFPVARTFEQVSIQR